MYVACSTLSFSKVSLEDALRTVREMRFTKADLAIHEGGPHLTPAEVVADLGRCVQRLKATNLPLASIHLITSATDTVGARKEFQAVCRLARVCTVPLLTVPAAPIGSDLDAEVARLQDWVRIAEAEGVILSVETHAQTVTADPQGAAELCRRVPGLALTLDPSHYHSGPHASADYECLLKFVRHVRLRDTGTGTDQFQVRIGQGEMEFGRLLTQLDRCRYDRALTVDVRDIPDSPFPIVPEVRKLKYLLESLV
ncbi:Xylose isomerase-like TIM barrel [Gemmata obscuriglobus]|uniref:Sugar phosphate isomerase/epimerase n=1 Tax=Gemmata obscuriglobus TaxID=114 RepID=A0A2Z3GXY1_9BACT|nr:TIM barrel protein [Gemmata obscuriglobus]AWM38613.1 sugar phosphate isomerase/epimerase [Gemmata obscuriglobus]QEG28429.1 Xylose isomerase-like TIM barrel [Gemmata obscuriglobus]VTS06395.1 Sugar phosphate isomerase/epimerase OS=Singulisphaera acidiphila (strain ATCC BAA-1392 / DSM 18658 / VKM B-2454 / MOB10) GN=Sinac_7331 PE=4 SV=1: AP_endonuc_2 [Gemmata obscuriglobus UQM 2246]